MKKNPMKLGVLLLPLAFQACFQSEKPGQTETLLPTAALTECPDQRPIWDAYKTDGLAFDVSASRTMDWVVGTNTAGTNQGYRLYKWYNHGWEDRGGGAHFISTGNTHAYVVNTSGKMHYMKTTGGWEPIAGLPGGLIMGDLAVTDNEAVYVIGSTTWTYNGDPVTYGGEIYLRNNANGSWTKKSASPVRYHHVAADSNGRIFAIRAVPGPTSGPGPQGNFDVGEVKADGTFLEGFGYKAKDISAVGNGIVFIVTFNEGWVIKYDTVNRCSSHIYQDASNHLVAKRIDAKNPNSIWITKDDNTIWRVMAR